eukprot:m.356718 g.356718  ORF g.356718 m.356718 type:complete len:284 (+) comp17611_c0_seq1:127-978(+)
MFCSTGLTFTGFCITDANITMSAFEKALKLSKDLKGLWKAGDIDGCKPILTQLKIALTELSFLPSTKDEMGEQKELLLIRDVLEIGAQHAIKCGDVDAFKRYMARLKTYYFDYCDHCPESTYMYELLGLNLLSLLADSNIAEFHCELERLDSALLEDNPYLRHAVLVEQYMMEGAYNKVFLVRKSTPAESYQFFMDRLVETIQHEIAECCAAAYDNLSISALQKLLNASSEQETIDLVQQYPDWEVKDGTVTFPNTQYQSAAVDSRAIIARTLDYAKGIEQIV